MSNTDTVSELARGAIVAITKRRLERAQEIATAMLLGGSVMVRPGDGVELIPLALGLIIKRQLDEGALPGHREIMREAILSVIAMLTEDEA